MEKPHRGNNLKYRSGSCDNLIVFIIAKRCFTFEHDEPLAAFQSTLFTG